ncbi:hypothetical protein OTU49_005437 [Cherax quadricarinatus]|uniref:Uncharacterized protein n=1 Tax=Cherax quadricarinatus TaxID=27406 RepID=A0AAW0XBU4_CHEQU
MPRVLRGIIATVTSQPSRLGLSQPSRPGLSQPARPGTWSQPACQTWYLVSASLPDLVSRYKINSFHRSTQFFSELFSYLLTLSFLIFKKSIYSFIWTGFINNNINVTSHIIKH